MIVRIHDSVIQLCGEDEWRAVQAEGIVCSEYWTVYMFVVSGLFVDPARHTLNFHMIQRKRLTFTSSTIHI